MRRLRVERLLSQESLAFEAQIDRTYVSRLERGLENPTVGLLEKIAASLQIDIVDLLHPLSPSDTPPRTLPSGRKRAMRLRPPRRQLAVTAVKE